MGDNNLPIVLVTGFGPFSNRFREYNVNASWEAVKLLELDGVKLIKHEIPVAYDSVDGMVPELWNQHNPDLIIHCGVSHLAEGLVFEKVAHSAGYTSCDIKGCIPSNDTKTGSDNEVQEAPVKSECPSIKCLSSKIDVSRVSERINELFSEHQVKMPAVTSQNAGRYLCEYIYYKSLCQDPSRTVFIHIPELQKYSAEESSTALKHAVAFLLDELKQNQMKNDRTCSIQTS